MSLSGWPWSRVPCNDQRMEETLVAGAKNADREWYRLKAAAVVTLTALVQATSPEAAEDLGVDLPRTAWKADPFGQVDLRDLEVKEVGEKE